MDELTTEQLELLADIHDYELGLAMAHWRLCTPERTPALATSHCGRQTAPASTSRAMTP